MFLFVCCCCFVFFLGGGVLGGSRGDKEAHADFWGLFGIFLWIFQMWFLGAFIMGMPHTGVNPGGWGIYTPHFLARGDGP